MVFYKDFSGLILFIICHLVFILQFFFIYELSDVIDNKQNKFLLFHKIINYILLFLSVYSHIKTSIIDPGTISMDNNEEIIEFYYYVHEPLIKRAIYITKKKTPEVIRKIIFDDNKKQKKEHENNNSIDNDNDNDDEKTSDIDDYPFEPKSCINDDMQKAIEEKYHMKLSRCKNCFVIRPINSHHCSVCHKCYIAQDHHCPWVNNCIGLFNKKVFILFLCYSSIQVLYSLILFFYYSLYKNIDQFNTNPGLLVLDISAIVFGLILAIVSVMLLWDQYDSISNDCIECDFKKGILLERSSEKQQFQIIFGGIFSYKWLLPFYPGGNNDFLKQMSLLKKLKNNKKKNNKKMQTNEDIENKSKKE